MYVVVHCLGVRTYIIACINVNVWMRQARPDLTACRDDLAIREQSIAQGPTNLIYRLIMRRSGGIYMYCMQLETAASWGAAAQQ